MSKIYHRSNNELKHSHAYDEHGNYLSIESAIKLQNKEVCKWYLDFDKQIELILCALGSNKVTSHWKAKPNQFLTTTDGIKRKYNQDHQSESFEHIRFKGQIIEKLFFNFKNYKILLKNAKPEFVFSDKKFRTDVKAELLDGTLCMIEVIKTSELSEKKLNEINKNQILTFKLYIDEYGNQKHNKSKIIGNKELEHIEKSIQKGNGKIAEIEESIEEMERRIYQERKRYDATNSYKVREFEKWIFGRLKGFELEIINKKGEIEDRQDPIEKIRNRIGEINQRIEQFRIEIEKNENTNLQIEQQIRQAEDEQFELKRKINIIENIDWNELFNELEKFGNIEVKLNKAEKINNLQNFIKGHKAVVVSDYHIDYKRPYISRILKVKEILAI
jgi:predicted  nucleic acid-binding Zn-ribbon protein